MSPLAASRVAQSNLRINSFDPGPLRSGVRLRGFPGERAESVPPPESVVPQLLWLLGADSRGVSGCAL